MKMIVKIRNISEGDEIITMDMTKEKLVNLLNDIKKELEDELKEIEEIENSIDDLDDDVIIHFKRDGD